MKHSRLALHKKTNRFARTLPLQARRSTAFVRISLVIVAMVLIRVIPVLPAEANTDLERVRGLLERVIAQAQEISKEQGRAYESFALLEDVLGIRLSLAKNDDERAQVADRVPQRKREDGFVTGIFAR